MTPIKTARQLRGLSQTELASRMGISPQALNQYESGTRNLGPKQLPIAAQALDVSDAYLSDCAQTLPVYDCISGRTHMAAIMREECIEDYGMLYLCDVPDVGPISVILSSGVQFTLSDWQGAQVMSADQIADPPNGRWVDGRGIDAIMLHGLPRIIL